MKSLQKVYIYIYIYISFHCRTLKTSRVEVIVNVLSKFPEFVTSKNGLQETKQTFCFDINARLVHWNHCCFISAFNE